MQLTLFMTLFLSSVGLARFFNCTHTGRGCPSDMRCYIDARKCKIGFDCGGVCFFRNPYQPCLGNGSCLPDEECIDDIRDPDACGRSCDEAGVCVPQQRKKCGGFAGWLCPTGRFCYNIPGMGCDPTKGGKDCLGECL